MKEVMMKLRPNLLPPAVTRAFSCPVSSDHVSSTSSHTIPAEARSFDSIPGPRSLPLLGTLYKYLPAVGEYKFDRLHINGLKKLQKYGPLVREDIVPGVPVVWVYSPDDIETVYRCEGRYPERRSHLALQKYRQDRPHLYNCGGLLPTNGEEWWRIRSVFQRNLSRVQDVRAHLEITDEITSLFLEYVGRDNTVNDFLPKLARFYLELTCMVAFYKRLESFSSSEQSSSSRSSQLIEAAETTNSCILRTDNGPRMWRYWRTPLYRKMEKALNTLEITAIQLVDQLHQELKEHKDDRRQSLIGQYLTFPELDTRDIYGMAVDLILAGIDTTSYTSSFALYHLATNPDIQEQLFQETYQLLPEPGDQVTSDVLAHASFTRAVVKETLRLNPVSVGVGRILAKEAVFSGFRVPAGTVVVTQNQVACRLEQFFPQPDRFLPDRWVKGSSHYRVCSPYLVLPFGHGPRTCIARRLAEQAFQVLLLKLVRQYKVSWHGASAHLGVRSLLINKPDQPVLLRLSHRSPP